MTEPRTDDESKALADSFNRLERVEEFGHYRAELMRERGLIVDQLLIGRADSYETYLELRAEWQGLGRAIGLTGAVVDEAMMVEGE